MTDPLNPGDPGGAADQDQTDGGDLTAYRTGAMTSQSDIDKAKIRYGSALGSNYRAEETGWDGLTKEQEIQQEHLWRDRAIAEAEYEEQMQEVRARADAMIARLDEEERQCREKLKEVQKRPIILQDGRVVEPDKNGQFITDQTGRALTDTERAEAERQQHKKEADERALDDQLAQIDEAKNHIRKAQALASQGGANLTPEQMKQNEAQAQHELATAQTITQKQTHYETSTDASSTLSRRWASVARPSGQHRSLPVWIKKTAGLRCCKTSSPARSKARPLRRRTIRHPPETRCRKRKLSSRISNQQASAVSPVIIRSICGIFSA
jgi:hypothetical protein